MYTSGYIHHVNVYICVIRKCLLNRVKKVRSQSSHFSSICQRLVTWFKMGKQLSPYKNINCEA